jgi:hypothetical protein
MLITKVTTKTNSDDVESEIYLFDGHLDNDEIKELVGDSYTVEYLVGVPSASGAGEIAKERLRQMNEEYFDAHHDDLHINGELAKAALHYLRAGLEGQGYTLNNTEPPPPGWPWETFWFKPSPLPQRNFEKAGALLAAEMDRQSRMKKLATESAVEKDDFSFFND